MVLKRIIWLVCVFATCFNLLAQTSQTLPKNNVEYGRDLLEKGKFREAETLFKLLIRQNEKDKTNPIYSGAYNGLASVRHRRGFLQESDSLFQGVMALRAKQFGTNSLEYAETLCDYVNLLVERQHLDTAVPYAKESLRIRKEQLGVQSEEYAESGIALGACYLFAINLKDTKRLIDEITPICKAKKNTNPFLYLQYLQLCANYCLYANDYVECGKYYDEIFAFYESQNEFGEFNYAVTLLAYTTYLASVSRNDEALSFNIKAKDILEPLVGKNHPYYLIAASNLGTYYLQLKEYDKAEDYIFNTLQPIADVYGKHHSVYFYLLSGAAYCCAVTGQNEKAEKLYLESVQLRREMRGNVHEDVANALNGLGNFYLGLGNYTAAEKCFVEAWDILEKLGSPRTLLSGLVLNSLGIIAAHSSSAKASGYYEKSLGIFKEIVGENHPYYIQVYSNYITVKDSSPAKQSKEQPRAQSYEDSEKEYLKLIESYEKNHKRENSDNYAKVLNDFSTFLLINNKPQKAKYALDRLVYLLDEAEHKPTQISTIYLLNIAYNYYLAKDANKSISRFLKAMDSFRSDLENNFAFMSEKEKELYWNRHQGFLDGLKSIAYEGFKGNDKSASVAAYDGELIGKSILLYSGLKRQQLIFNQEDTDLHQKWDGLLDDKALFNEYQTQIDEIEDEILRRLAVNYPHSIEKIIKAEEAPYSAELGSSFYEMYKQTIEDMEATDRDLEEIYKTTKYEDITDLEVKKSIAEFNEAKKEWNEYIPTLLKRFAPNHRENLQEAVYSTKNKPLIDLWNNWVFLKDTSVRLDEQIERSDKEIIRHSQSNTAQLDDFSIRWGDVKAALQSDEAAIEFVRAEPFEAFFPSIPEPLYYALLLRSNSQSPELIPLCTERQLQTAILKFPYDGQAVYPLIWKPLEKYLQGAKTVFLAPTGLLNNVSFAGMKSGMQYLNDKYLIHNLLSTRDILSLKEKANLYAHANKQAVLFGGADFGLSSKDLATVDRDLQKDYYANLTRSALDDLNQTRGQGFEYLPGSKKEVQSVNKLLSGLNWKTHLYVDEQATETRFKSFVGVQSPEILHISTHGFYFPLAAKKKEWTSGSSESTNQYRLSEDPLMRSGLAFSGANHVWNGKEISTTDDGILTAYEVSKMNLSNTQLVVLSACKTGLGDIVGGEGVFGLQRAFRLAGVDAMIVSIWEVPDKETIELMTEFYSQWSTGISMKLAFTNAQRMMQKAYPDAPKNWAGFMLIE